MAMFNAVEFFNVRQPYHMETKMQYEKLHIIIQKGECPEKDHRNCVLSQYWNNVATELYNRTCQWIDSHPTSSDMNERAAKDIRMNNKDRLEYIIIRAPGKYDIVKYEICMDLLHITLAHELTAIHHLDMFVTEQIKFFRDEINGYYRSLLMWDRVNPTSQSYMFNN